MGKNTVTLKAHLAALREADMRFDEERNLRYKEVGEEREKALKIKETADLAALQLAREIQTYKDEKANELREQINSERGLYATNRDMEPIKAYISAQTGKGIGLNAAAALLFSVVTVGIALAVYLKP